MHVERPADGDFAGPLSSPPPEPVASRRSDAAPPLPTGLFRCRMVLLLAAAAACVAAYAVVASDPPWPVGDERARAHATASATGSVVRTEPAADSHQRITVAWADEAGTAHTSVFSLYDVTGYKVEDPFALRYDPAHPDSRVVVADPSLTDNAYIAFQLACIPGTLALIALSAAGAMAMRRRRIRKALGRGIILSWQGVVDVIPHLPEQGNAWDLPDTRRAWWRGIRRAWASYTFALLIGGLLYSGGGGYLAAAHRDRDWLSTVLEEIVILSGFAAIYAAVRVPQLWLLRSRPWQAWQGTPAPASGSSNTALRVLSPEKWRRSLIRVTGLEPGGRTVTAVLRSSRWQNHPELPAESAGQCCWCAVPTESPSSSPQRKSAPRHGCCGCHARLASTNVGRGRSMGRRLLLPGPIRPAPTKQRRHKLPPSLPRMLPPISHRPRHKTPHDVGPATHPERRADNPFPAARPSNGGSVLARPGLHRPAPPRRSTTHTTTCRDKSAIGVAPGRARR